MDINDVIYTSSIQLKELRGKSKGKNESMSSNRAQTRSVSPTDNHPLEDIPITDSQLPSSDLDMDGDPGEFIEGGREGSISLLDKQGRFRLWRKLKQASETRYHAFYKNMVERKSHIQKELDQLSEDKAKEEQRANQRLYENSPKFNDDFEKGIGGGKRGKKEKGDGNNRKKRNILYLSSKSSLGLCDENEGDEEMKNEMQTKEGAYDDEDEIIEDEYDDYNYKYKLGDEKSEEQRKEKESFLNSFKTQNSDKFDVKENVNRIQAENSINFARVASNLYLLTLHIDRFFTSFILTIISGTSHFRKDSGISNGDNFSSEDSLCTILHAKFFRLFLLLIGTSTLCYIIIYLLATIFSTTTQLAIYYDQKEGILLYGDGIVNPSLFYSQSYSYYYNTQANAHKVGGPNAQFFREEDINLKNAKSNIGNGELMASLQTPRIVISNEYSPDTSIDTAAAYGWKLFAEPYRKSTLSIYPHSAKYIYQWRINDHLQGYGPTVDVMFTKTGYNKLELIITSRRHGSFMRMIMEDIMVKYVRREIRSLTDFDREAFFQGIMIMQRVPMSVGQRLYGKPYRDKDYFNRMHIYFGGSPDCDHWHKGPGFVTSHMAITYEFEQALQAINPLITVPYWDFTLESTMYTADDWRTSSVFSPDWFGDSSPLLFVSKKDDIKEKTGGRFANDKDIHSKNSNHDKDHKHYFYEKYELHTITKGRWAYVPVMTEAKRYSRITNSYKLLRAPWNNDPTPFLTRSGDVYGYRNNLKPSGCKEYQQAAYSTDWMKFSSNANSIAHGHLHELMGGSWNHNFGEDLHHQRTSSILTFAHSIQSLSKEIWRHGYIQCPQSCSMNTPSSMCQCKCSNEVLNSPHPEKILYESGVLGHLFYIDTEALSSSPSSSSTKDNEEEQEYLLDFEKKKIATAENQIILGDDDEIVGEYINQVIPGLKTKEESHEVYSSIVKTLCSPGHIGDMFQATSTNDITFWVIHPLIDRLWHRVRMANEHNLQDQDNQRKGKKGNHASSFTFSEEWKEGRASCYGHGEENITPFRNLFNLDFTQGYGEDKDIFRNNEEYNSAGRDKREKSREELQKDRIEQKARGIIPGLEPLHDDDYDVFYTNKALYRNLHPIHGKINYVYDNFQWDHCTATGIPVTTHAELMYSK